MKPFPLGHGGMACSKYRGGRLGVRRKGRSEKSAKQTLKAC